MHRAAAKKSPPSDRYRDRGTVGHRWFPGLRMLLLLATCCLAWESVAAGFGEIAVPPLVFEGFGLGHESGPRCVATALRRIEAERRRDADSEIPLEFGVQGPSGSEAVTSALAAEVRSRIEGFDIAAGMRADPDVIRQGPARWTGRIGLATERENGCEKIELRTSLASRDTTGVLGFEVGPRIERRLRRGTVFFIDGKAEAQAIRSADGGSWAMPGSLNADGLGMLGVMARTGVVH